jgi:hypothetical protein
MLNDGLESGHDTLGRTPHNRRAIDSLAGQSSR